MSLLPRSVPGLRAQRAVLRVGAVVVVVALVTAAFIGTVAPESAQAYRQATSVSGTTISYPDGVTITGAVTSGTNGAPSIAATGAGGFGSSNGYQAADYSPTVPTTTPGVVLLLPASNNCAAYAVCANRGTLTFTFNRPLRNVRMHIAELGGTAGNTATTNSTSAKLTLTTPGLVTTVDSGRNLRITGGSTIEAGGKSMDPSCTPVGATSPPGCGTILFTGVTSSLTFTLSSEMARKSGTANAAVVGPDAWPTTFTYDEDFGDAPSSYDQGNAARSAIGDMFLGANSTADNATTANSATGPNVSATASGDTDDALPGGLTNIVATPGSSYGVVLPIASPTQASAVCGWIDFNKNGLFDSPAERACSGALAARATSAALTFTVPADTTPGATFARFRIGPSTEAVAATPVGTSSQGEVEDYPVSLLAQSDFVCTADTIYALNQNAPHQLARVTPSTGRLEPIGQVLPASNDAINGLALPPGSGDIAWGMDRTSQQIVRYDIQTGTSQLFPAIADPAQNSVIGGAINPANGIYYYAGGGASWTLWAFNTLTNTSIGKVATVSGSGLGGNGDIVFDSEGRLYIVSNPTAGGAGTVARVETPLPTTAGTTALTATTTTLTTTPATTGQYNSVAFDASGAVVIGTVTGATVGVIRLNPASGAVLSNISSTGGIAFNDFASCNTPNLIRAQKNLPAGRDVATDQFTLTITGGGITTTNTGTTAGTDSGLQDTQPETAGSALGLDGTTYTVTETAAGGANLARYVRSWACVDTANANAPISSGTGLVATFTMPTADAAHSVLCTFTNLPLGTIRLQKALPGGRLLSGDQFGLTIGGPGVPATATATTTGTGTTATGTATFATAIPGTAYTLAETGAAGATVDFYTSTWSCVDTANGNAAVASGSGATGAVTVPSPGGPNPANILCTFSNAPKAASISFDKSASAVNDLDGNGPDPGDTIDYSFAVTNTGGLPLTPITVADAKVGPVTCPAGALAPGATVTCTAAPYTLTAADTDSGAVNNTATAAGVSPTGLQVTGSDSTTTPVAPAPNISLDKSASPINDLDGNGPDAGDTITYTFAVTNTGNVTLNPVRVADPKIGPVGCPVGPLAPGATVNCDTRLFTLTQADVNSGAVNNTATATGTSPARTRVTSVDTVTVRVPPRPALSLDKTAGALLDVDADGPDAGDTITYGFAVTNTGNLPLNPVTVSDPKVGPVTCPVGELAPGDTVNCTSVTYTLTQADVGSGAVNNTATATGTPPSGGPVTANDSTSTPVPANPRISLDKVGGPIIDLDGNGPDAGDTVTYTFAVLNRGNLPLNPVTVTDPLVGPITCPTGALAPGATINCSSSVYTLTQADVNSGRVINTATATGTPPSGAPVISNDTVVTPVPQRQAIALDKTAGALTDVDGNGPDAGDTITFGFAVTNTGNLTLNPVTVADAKVGPVTCPTGALAPGATVSCTPRTYTLTQADVDAGVVNNTATTTGTTPSGARLTASDSTATPVAAQPTIVLDKTAGAITDIDGNGNSTDAGDTITYTFAVTNTGNVTLNPVVVADPKVGPVTCPSGALAPGATVNCAAVTYAMTQADVDSGAVNNTATATGTPPAGTPVRAADSTTTPVVSDPAIELVKSANGLADADGDGEQGAGDTITYTFTVTNLGNVTLNPVTVTDPKVGAVTCPPGALPRNATVTCTAAPYVLTQADADSGAVNNTAVATGTPPTGAPVTDDSSTTTRATVTSGIDLVKTATPNTATTAGTAITYTFAGANTGRTTLTNVSISDPLPGLSALTCTPAQPIASLAPRGTITCTASRSLTQADVDAGGVSNTATITGTPPSGPPISDSNPAVVTVLPTPSVALVKSAGQLTDVDGNGPDAGDTIAYSFVATNTGNVTLNPVTVADPKVGPVTCPAGALAPAASISCTATPYALSQADVDSGAVNNTATVIGTPPTGAPVTAPSSTTTPVAANPIIALDKSAGALADVDGNGRDAGDTIRYSFAVTNTGNVTLNPVTVADPKAGPVTCPTGALAPGATTSCTAVTYTLTQADVNSGAVNNTATASGTPPTGAPVNAPDSTTTPVIAAPAIQLVKSAGSLTDANGDGAKSAGDTITYTFVVTNIGNVTLDPVAVADPKVGAVTCPPSALAPTATVTCTAAPYSLTQADVDAGAVNNTATATGTPPSGAPVTDDSSTSTSVIAVSLIDLVKTAAPTSASAAGDAITYTFVGTNTGQTTLTNVAVIDPMPGLSALTCTPAQPIATLSPGATVTCTATRALTQTDVDAGRVTNTATITGAPPTGPAVTDTDPAEVTISPAPSIDLVKAAGALADANGDGVQSAGRHDHLFVRGDEYRQRHPHPGDRRRPEGRRGDVSAGGPGTHGIRDVHGGAIRTHPGRRRQRRGG